MSEAPKALHYAEPLAKAEAQLVAALPAILDGLIAHAKVGDIRAGVYLCDQLMGRTAGAKAAPADDREPPLSEEAFRLGRDGRRIERTPRIIIPGSDPRPSGAREEV